MNVNRLLGTWGWNTLKGFVNENAVDWDSLAEELSANEEEEVEVEPETETDETPTKKSEGTSGIVAAALKLEQGGKSSKFGGPTVHLCQLGGCSSFQSHPGRSHAGEYYPGLLNAAGNLCFLNATLQVRPLPSLSASMVL